MAKKQQMQLSIILVKALDCSPEERDVGQIFKLVSGLHDGQPEEWREVILNGSPPITLASTCLMESYTVLREFPINPE